MKGKPIVIPISKCTKHFYPDGTTNCWLFIEHLSPYLNHRDVNNTPPIIADRFIIFENDTFCANQKIKQIIVIRVTLTRNSIKCFIIPPLALSSRLTIVNLSRLV